MNTIKNEKLFLFFYDKNNFGEICQSDVGRKQFFEDQSFGKKPQNPDIFYLQLDSGKCSFDLQTRTIQQEYEKSLQHGYYKTNFGGWNGWYQFRQDWLKDLWVLPFILKWAEKIIDIEKFMKWEKVEPDFYLVK